MNAPKYPSKTPALMIQGCTSDAGKSVLAAAICRILARRDLRVGELLDGEGGYTVWGKLLPAATSRALGGLPLGLAHGVKLVRPVAKGQSLCWDDVAMDTSSAAYRLRREMEALSAG
jgi:predicted homoserine dehydrogenase-like protein